jgi:hypothetical protein
MVRSRAMSEKRKDEIQQALKSDKYNKYDSFVIICIIQLIIGLIAITIAGYIFFKECDFIKGGKCEPESPTITGLVINAIVVVLGMFGIVVAASELPLAFHPQKTLLDIVKMDYKFERARRLQIRHTWFSLLMSLITFLIFFIDIYQYFLQVLNGEHVFSNPNSNNQIRQDQLVKTRLCLILLVFYFTEFILFNMTAVANRATIIGAIVKRYNAISSEQAATKGEIITKIGNDLGLDDENKEDLELQKLENSRSDETTPLKANGY